MNQAAPAEDAGAPSSEASDETAESLVVFTPSGRRGRFAHGTPVLTAARKLGVDVDSVCGGRGLCGRCQVVPSFGDFAKHGISSSETHLTASGEVEARYGRRKGLKSGRRLSCQTLIQGDLVIDVPADSQVHKQVVRKRAEARDIRVDPLVRLYFVEVEEPDMHHPSGDLQRLKTALEREWQVLVSETDTSVLKTLQATLRKGKWQVTAAVYDGKRLVALWPGLKERVHGLAVDIGSTTIAAHLTDLSSGEVVASGGLMNPQIRFGEDLMSRVSYVMMNPGGEVELIRAVREGLDSLTAEIAAEAGIAVEDILDATVVGNPIMHHLALGLDPTELGGAPFALVTNEMVTVPAQELALHLHPGAQVTFLPLIAGHVGADTAAVVLSEAPQRAEPLTLLVDVGTNAEIVLGNKTRLLACSSPTGPAFEGAQISCGQRAAPGAIERVRIDRETLQPRFKVIGSELWSDEEGFAEQTKRIGVTGVCGSGIIELIAEMFLSGIVESDGTIDGKLAERSNRIAAEGRTFTYLVHEGETPIQVTQNDIRAIQLAKAALYAGARLLLDHFGAESPERVVLAGAFGSHIDPLYAMVLGLIPDCPLDGVASAGNAAGTGARIALLDRTARAEISEVVHAVDKIETAVEPRFQEHFVAAMAFPHKTAPYPNLSKAVTLPERSVGSESEEAPRRRRRRGGN